MTLARLPKPPSEVFTAQHYVRTYVRTYIWPPVDGAFVARSGQNPLFQNPMGTLLSAKTGPRHSKTPPKEAYTWRPDLGQQWKYKYKCRGHYYFCDVRFYVRFYRMLLHPHKERIHSNPTRGSHSNKNYVRNMPGKLRITYYDGCTYVRTLTHVRTYVLHRLYIRAYVFVSSPQ